MSLFPSLDDISKDETLKGTRVNAKFSTVEFMYDTFIQKLESGDLTTNQIISDIMNNYSNYCDYDNFKSPSTRKKFQRLWTTDKFLECFIYALRNEQFKKCINEYYNIGICKIVYDYYAQFKDNNTSRLMLNIVKIINYNTILVLSSMMHEKSALFIVMSKYSSFIPEVCVHRVNEFIIKLGYDFSIEQIIQIYGYLYSNSFAKLFKFTMTTAMNDLDPKQSIINDRISQALVIILGSMTSVEMEKVIIQYINYVIQSGKKDTRFSLRNVSKIYNDSNTGRIYTTLDAIEFKGYSII